MRKLLGWPHYIVPEESPSDHHPFSGDLLPNPQLVDSVGWSHELRVPICECSSLLLFITITITMAIAIAIAIIIVIIIIIISSSSIISSLSVSAFEWGYNVLQVKQLQLSRPLAGGLSSVRPPFYLPVGHPDRFRRGTQRQERSND